MATTRKSTSAKTPSKKTAAPAAAIKPAAVKPAATPVATKPAAKKITAEERRRMIEEAAYYIAERSGFSSDSAADWDKAVAQIDAELARKGVTVA
jgi:hypothetical protein